MADKRAKRASRIVTALKGLVGSSTREEPEDLDVDKAVEMNEIPHDAVHPLQSQEPKSSKDTREDLSESLQQPLLLPPPPPPPQPLPPPPQPLPRNDHTLQNTLPKSTIAWAVIVLVVGALIVVRWGPQDDSPKVQLEMQEETDDDDPYPMVKFMAAGKCMILMPEQIIDGGEHQLKQLDHIRTSMQHYMDNFKYDGICALDIGYPVCFCLLRQKMSDQVIGLYNFNITTLSNSLRLNKESSHFCPDDSFRFVPRSTTIFVEYLTVDGGYMQREFYERDSFSLQNMWELNHGVTVCDREEKIQYIEECYEQHMASSHDPNMNFRTARVAQHHTYQQLPDTRYQNPIVY